MYKIRNDGGNDVIQRKLRKSYATILHSSVNKFENLDEVDDFLGNTV